MRRLVIWLLAGIVVILLTVLAFCPAAWMAAVLERQTGGRLTLGDAQGTLWNGSAFIGGAPGENQPVTPLLPGRFAWKLSPLVLAGQVDAELQNPEALTQALRISGSWDQWQLSAGTLTLPAERLAALGAPLNTVQLSGQMRLSWDALQLVRQGRRLDVTGTMKLALDDIASRLSPIKPLGAYLVVLDWRGPQAEMKLSSVKGPLLLSGAGSLVNGRMQFSGRAEAEPGQEEKLANLLGLLGQRRKEGEKNVIALEFK